MNLVVLDYEVNLSLQEYLYFQECPQKFRLHRILNPIPTKLGFLQAKSSIDRYYLREYPDREIEGIKKHQFFATFHQHYEQDLVSNVIPEELTLEPELLLFWEYQQKRYQDSKERYPWLPLRTELPVMTTKQRGIIDSIEYINCDEELRIIDYKKNKHENDLESLYFYAILLEDFMTDLNWEGFRIEEIGCYYYLNGELCIEKYNIDIKNKIKKKIDSTLNKIVNEKFILQKNACINCSLKMVCRIENGRR